MRPLFIERKNSALQASDTTDPKSLEREVELPSSHISEICRQLNVDRPIGL